MIRNFLMVFFVVSFSVACNKSESPEATQSSTEQTATEGQSGSGNKGIGPITSVEIGAEVNAEMVAKGQELFNAKCAACHKIGERYVGPDLKDVSKRRTPEWVMNMILNPEQMTKEDPTAQELLGEFMTQMTFQNVTQEEARAILEFFRSNDSK